MLTWKIVPGILHRCPRKVSTKVNYCCHTPHQGKIAGSLQSFPPLLYWYLRNEWKENFHCRINQESSRFCVMITWNIINLYYGINYLSIKFKSLQKKFKGLSLSMIITIFLLAQFILTRGVLFYFFKGKKTAFID